MRSPFFRTSFGTAARLAGVYAVILGAVLVASGAALLHNTQTGVEAIAVRQLSAELRSYQKALTARPAGQSLLDASTAYLRSHAVPSGDMVAINVSGSSTVANSTARTLTADPVIGGLLSSRPTRTTIDSRSVSGQQTEVLASPIWDSGNLAGVFVATDSLSDLQPAASASLRLALGEGLVALVAGVASAYLLLRRLLRRVGRITQAAENIGSNRLAGRLGDQGTPDEVGELARSFDSMLDRIETAVNAQHELLSDVSHQLRTPLTVARGHLEILGRTDPGDRRELRETIDVAIDELDRMNELIERLLILGRAREPGRRRRQLVDLRSYLADLHRSCQVMADREWLLGPIPDEVVSFDEVEVRGALLNLIDNAVKATTAGDSVAMSTALDPDGRHLRLTVEDSGPGIPESQRAAVLDRFTRPATRPAGGAGLGLAIVRAVCEAHMGRVEIGTSQLGGAKVVMVIDAGPDTGPDARPNAGAPSHGREVPCTF